MVREGGQRMDGWMEMETKGGGRAREGSGWVAERNESEEESSVNISSGMMEH